MARSPFPKYRRHPNGQAFIQIKGTRHYLGKFDTAESRSKYGEFIKQLGQNPTAAAAAAAEHVGICRTGLTVVELAAMYVDHAKVYYQKNGVVTETAEHVRRALLEADKLFGDLPVKRFGPLCLIEIQEALVAKGLSRRYINDVVDKIRRCFKWAVSRQLAPPDIYTALATVEGLRKGRSAAREPDPILPVDDAVVDATLPYLTRIVGDMIRLQLLAGCRPGEICQLRPGDVDRSGDVWAFTPATHKTEHRGKRRVIYFGPRAQAILQPYLFRDAEAHCFSPAESEEERHAAQRSARKTPVQPSQHNRRVEVRSRPPANRYVKDTYRRAIHRAVARANRAIKKTAAAAGIESPALLPVWSPNQLRHSRATEIRRKFGLEAAQVSLGHTRADVTQVYAERDFTLAADVMRKIG